MQPGDCINLLVTPGWSYADATRRVDMKGIVAVTASPSFSLGFTRRWLQLHTGSHRFLIALARNDDVLYPMPAAVFPLTVR